MVDPIKLPEVTVTANRYKKAKAKLYPKGEVNQSSIDSLRKAGHGKLIGEPIKRSGHMDVYGPDASDRIKQLMRKK